MRSQSMWALGGLTLLLATASAQTYGSKTVSMADIANEPMEKTQDAQQAPKKAKRPKTHTSLHTLMLDGEIEMEKVTALVEAGAEVDERDDGGQTPLMIAALMKVEELLEHLLTLGADPMARDPQGSTALHMAASLGHTEIIDLLVAAGGDAAVGAENLMGSTPLHFAARGGKVGAVYKLITHGANVRAKDRSGARPEDEARRHLQTQPPGSPLEKDIQSAIKALKEAPTPEERKRMKEERAASNKGTGKKGATGKKKKKNAVSKKARTKKRAAKADAQGIKSEL